FGPEVGNVVDGPAERVHGVEGVAAGPGQREEGVVEVRAASPGQPRDQVGAGHDAAVFTAGAPRLEPRAPNQSTASRRAPRPSVRGNPSPRPALAAPQNMRS